MMIRRSFVALAASLMTLTAFTATLSVESAGVPVQAQVA
jgi:hypothetical protein